ncbi:hypothetical protein GALL_539540 [mine drainage metagenome]|uniref:Uncharacterized protein n=1 Tax=mine drainage metagenome TaxID=410659 RepID=A0A1J5P9L0_9ZZZZ
MHRPRHCECAERLAKAMIGRKPASLQFRIAAGQPADVGVRIRSLIGQRRERHDLSAGGTPAFEHMRIDEGKGGIARQRNALAGRRHGRAGGRALRGPIAFRQSQ